MRTTRWEGRVQVQVQLLLQEECLEQPNLRLEACLEQLPALPARLGRVHLTSHSLEPVALVLLPQLQLLQLLEALEPKQVKLADSLERNRQPLEHLLQPLLPLRLALGRQQLRQVACLASQPSLLEQLRQLLEPPNLLPLGSELRLQAQDLEASVLPLPSQQLPLASLEISLQNPHLDLAPLPQLQLLGLVVLEPLLPQVKHESIAKQIRTNIIALQEGVFLEQANLPNLHLLVSVALLLLHLQQQLVLEASELLPTLEEACLAILRPNLASASAAHQQLLQQGLGVLAQPLTQLAEVCLVVELSPEVSLEELQLDLELELDLEPAQALVQVPPQVD